MEVTIICYILVLHFVGDFVLQSREIGENKHKSISLLTKHIVIYTLVLCLINPLWAFINGILHFITDYTTSKVGYYYYVNNKKQLYIITHGVDQLLHYSALIVSYDIMLKNGII